MAWRTLRTGPHFQKWSGIELGPGHVNLIGPDHDCGLVKLGGLAHLCGLAQVSPYGLGQVVGPDPTRDRGLDQFRHWATLRIGGDVGGASVPTSRRYRHRAWKTAQRHCLTKLAQTISGTAGRADLLQVTIFV